MLFAVMTMMSLTLLPASAREYTQEDLTNPELFENQGGLEPSEENMTDDDFMRVALSQAKTEAEKEAIIQKYATAAQQDGQARSANAMPDDALPRKPTMQENSAWCSAATIQQTLRYMGASYSSQSDIMNSVEAVPGLNTVLNYINARKPAKFSNYVRKPVSGLSDFEERLSYSALNYQPMVSTLKNSKGSGVWPYSTGGHFTNCDGKLYGEYLFSDPHYRSWKPPHIQGLCFYERLYLHH